MADRAMMYCPRCDAMNPNPTVPINTELMRENHTYSCMFGHQVLGYDNLIALNPRLIQLTFTEKPGPTDVKTEVWLDPNVLSKFKERFPNQINSTVNSILSLHLNGDVVIVDGKQATELKRMGVKNGAEMVAAVLASQALESENTELKKNLDFLRTMFQGAGVESPV